MKQLGLVKRAIDDNTFRFVYEYDGVEIARSDWASHWNPNTNFNCLSSTRMEEALQNFAEALGLPITEIVKPLATSNYKPGK